MMILRSKQRAGRRRRVLPLRRGYSLAAVFLLIATIAVVLAMARSITWEGLSRSTTLANMVIGVIGGTLIGGTIGINYERRLQSTLVGIGAGAVTGFVGGVVTSADVNPVMVLMQCGVLIGLAVMVRMSTSTRPKLELGKHTVLIPHRSLRDRLANADRNKLLAGVAIVLATIASLIGRSQVTGRDWRSIAADVVLLLISLVVAGWLFHSALQTAQKSDPGRTADQGR